MFSCLIFAQIDLIFRAINKVLLVQRRRSWVWIHRKNIFFPRNWKFPAFFQTRKSSYLPATHVVLRSLKVILLFKSLSPKWYRSSRVMACICSLVNSHMWLSEMNGNSSDFGSEWIMQSFQKSSRFQSKCGIFWFSKSFLFFYLKVISPEFTFPALTYWFRNENAFLNFLAEHNVKEDL